MFSTKCGSRNAHYPKYAETQILTWKIKSGEPFNRG